MSSGTRRSRGSRRATKASPADSRSSETFRRQAPVSCRFCRTRKLRCSRSPPCSNCRSRGIACQPCDQPEIPSTDIVVLPTPGAALQLESLFEITERLQQLEKTVASHAQCWDRLMGGPPDSTGLVKSDPVKPDQSGTLDKEPSLYSFQRELTDQASFDLQFDVAPLARLVELPLWLMSQPRPARRIWLPLKSEAQALLSKYLDDINCLHPVIHIPSFQSTLDDTYACIDSGSAPDLARISLLLAIFVNAIILWTGADNTRGLHLTVDETLIQAPYWALAVRDVLECCRLKKASLEAVQAFLIVSSIGRGSVTIQSPHRYLQTAISMACELGLHRCDDSDRPFSSIIQRQVERRTWWCLTCYDWMAPALTNGPDQGLYQLEPHKMLVELPAHVNDADLTDTGATRERPLSEPTDMSYLLQRIRLAGISRRLVDYGPRMQPVDMIQIHSQLRAFERDIPSFFRMTRQNLSSTYGLDYAAACRIVTQGHALHEFLRAYYRRVRVPLYVWPTSPEPVARPIVETEPRIQRIVLHFEISLYGRPNTSRLAVPTSEALNFTQNPRSPSSLLHVVEGEKETANRLEFGGLGLSINAQVLQSNGPAVSSDFEWDSSPHFRFF